MTGAHALLTLALQLAAGGVAPDTDSLAAVAARVDSLYFARDPGGALQKCVDAFDAGMNVAPLRWRAARSLIAMGMLRPDGKERRALYDTALIHARLAHTLAPEDLDARYWVAAAAGRRAHRTDPAFSARLAMEVFEQTTAILARDSAHAGAHHALGRLHAEVARTPVLIRIIAGRVLRSELARRANWADAERHLRKAVELEPEELTYLVDLGDLYARRHRDTEAAAIAARVTLAPARHPMDEQIRASFINASARGR